MIRARSPYIITVNEASQVSTRIELWISATTYTTDPQYNLSKAIPASNAPTTYYDISPYIREYFDHTQYTDISGLTDTYSCTQLLNVKVKRYKTVGATETLIDTVEYKATDGYSEFADGVNYNGGNYLLDQKTYYVYNLASTGFITAYLPNNYQVKWTYPDGTDGTQIASPAGLYRFSYYPDFVVPDQSSWKIEVLNATDVVQATWYIKVIEECLYTPIKVDFINKHGAFQREFFFKASTDSIEVTNKDYNLMQPYNYSLTGGQRTTYNQNGMQTIKVNSGWVEEDFKDNLKQLMLSEKVLVDGKPAILKTKSIELNKSINTKQINYSLEFEFAYDLINSIV
ncbi:MAG: hypothetical protein KAY27_00430 [Pedobacter sp.]|nr:hypothetical protein [Pedobacter sp.]